MFVTVKFFWLNIFQTNLTLTLFLLVIMIIIVIWNKGKSICRPILYRRPKQNWINNIGKKKRGILTEQSTNQYILCQPFISHEWPRQNFSLQYQYNIKQTSDENNEKS